MIPAAGLILVGPVAWRGAISAVPGMLVPRSWRIAARRPYIDTRTGQEVRPPRPGVPGWIRKTTYAADRYRCLGCRMKGGTVRLNMTLVKLQLDHIIPYSFGGNITLWNCGTLCDRCNRIKSNYWRSDTGKVYYRAWRGAASRTLAGAILRRELAARVNPLRWMRAGRYWWVHVRK